MAEKLIRLPAVISQTGLSRSSIYKLIADDKNFPKRRYVNGNNKLMVFVESEIQSWIERQSHNTTCT